MALRKIDVDDEVFAFLGREAKPFVETTPNDVLRRLLLADLSKSSLTGATGVLMTLIEAGGLRVGDKLVHHQPRKRRTFNGEVTAEGFVQLADGRRFARPSPALKACVGHEINGWHNWVVERLGRSLQDLR